MTISDDSILAVYTSPGHNFFGHHGQAPEKHPMVNRVEVRCLAGRGLEGDRFLDYRDAYKGQVTFFEQEVYDSLCSNLMIHDKSISVFRRNIVTQGVDLNRLVGANFEIQGIRFHGVEECRPCYWMNLAFGPGAEKAMAGKGGLRAHILSSGNLSVNSGERRKVGSELLCEVGC